MTMRSDGRNSTPRPWLYDKRGVSGGAACPGESRAKRTNPGDARAYRPSWRPAIISPLTPRKNQFALEGTAPNSRRIASRSPTGTSSEPARPTAASLRLDGVSIAVWTSCPPISRRPRSCADAGLATSSSAPATTQLRPRPDIVRVDTIRNHPLKATTSSVPGRALPCSCPPALLGPCPPALPSSSPRVLPSPCPPVLRYRRALRAVVARARARP
jgi:hypothetical protein